MQDIMKIVNYFDWMAMYFSLQFGRCAMISVFVPGVVLVLRGIVLRNRIFLKGAVWSLFLLVPFMGKLRLFYESRMLVRAFFWWQRVCGRYAVIRWGYMLGILVNILLWYRSQRRLEKMLRGMNTEYICGERVYICEVPITPFSIGLRKPKIVIPKVIKQQFDDGEMKTILVLERMHIRLGHLWIYSLWNIVCAICWLNPFLVLCTDKMKEDMEHICDRFTIQRSGMDARSYGELLLKSITLLKSECVNGAAAFNGHSGSLMLHQKNFVSMRERLCKIRDYVPFSPRKAAALCVFLIAALSVLYGMVLQVSYPQYTELTDVIIEDEEGQIIAQREIDELAGVIEFENDTITIHNQAFLDMLSDDKSNEAVYFIAWGGFMKMPGLVIGSNGIDIESLSDGSVTSLRYVDSERNLFMKLIKWI